MLTLLDRDTGAASSRVVEFVMHRYLAEFDFRYSNRAALGVDDTARAMTALQGVVGKRLTYRGGTDTAH